MSTSNENAVFNVSSDQWLSILQHGNPLDGLPSDCLVGVQPDASVVEKEETRCCLTASDISKPVYESENNAKESSCTKAIIRDYIETFTSALIEQNELQSSTSFNAVSTAQYRTSSDDTNRNILFDDGTCVPNSSTKFLVLIPLCFTYIPVPEGISGNSGFSHGQKDDSSGKHQNESSSETFTQGFKTRYKEFANSGEFPISDAVAGSLGLNVKAQWHSERGQYICPVCEKGFRRKDNFLIHYRHHTGEKQFSCDSCERRFFTKYHLTRHLQIHRGERTFACDECDGRFALKCHLTRHYRTHTGEKPYKCPICGKAFADISVRNRHHRVIHNKKKT